MNVDDGGKTIVISSGENKDFLTVSYDECPLVAIDLAIAFMQLTQLGYRGGRQQMMFEMQKTVERQCVQQTIGHGARGAIPCRFAAVMLDQVANTDEEHRTNVDRQGPKEQHRRDDPTRQSKPKETIDASRKGQVLSQQATPVAVLGNVPHIPPHGVIGPDDQVPEGIERGPIVLQRTHRINLWDLRKAMVLQMDRFEGVEIHQIERTEHMSHQNIGLRAGKDIVMRKLMNEAIKYRWRMLKGTRNHAAKLASRNDSASAMVTRYSPSVLIRMVNFWRSFTQTCIVYRPPRVCCGNTGYRVPSPTGRGGKGPRCPPGTVPTSLNERHRYPHSLGRSSL